jgi:hypothetical protein
MEGEQIMAVQISEPNINQASLADWQTFILRTTAQGGGMTALALTNMDNSTIPQMAAGSRFEVNGAFYKCTAAETITGTPSANVINYIYANPSGASCSFSYSATKPTFDPAKGGWFNGNSRAIAKLFYISNPIQYNGKVILDSYSSMAMINDSQDLLGTSGYLFASGSINSESVVTLPPGAYRLEVKAGTGGKGGSLNTVSGGDGAAGEEKKEGFILLSQAKAVLSCGGDGAPGGGSSTNGLGTAGGGSTGGSSYIRLLGGCTEAIGGSGGGGAVSGDYNGGGGGGAGGYGVAQDGASSGGDATAGKGGHDGIGGDGGNDHSGGGVNGGGGGGGGGGGSGYIRGGNATANAGGGEGEPGGSGGQATDTNGLGGASSVSIILRNKFQGGGGAGYPGNATRYFGNGGGSLLSTSAGYARIYRLW